MADGPQRLRVGGVDGGNHQRDGNAGVAPAGAVVIGKHDVTVDADRHYPVADTFERYQQPVFGLR